MSAQHNICDIELTEQQLHVSEIVELVRDYLEKVSNKEYNKNTGILEDYDFKILSEFYRKMT